MIFRHKLTVRMYDTDAAGILYFASKFRFAHDTFEALLAVEGHNFHEFITQNDFMFVIVHAEADYKKSLIIGDDIEIRAYITKIGNSSFTLRYDVWNKEKGMVGSAQTVHVAIDKKTRRKRDIPDSMLGMLQKYLEPAH